MVFTWGILPPDGGQTLPKSEFARSLIQFEACSVKPDDLVSSYLLCAGVDFHEITDLEAAKEAATQALEKSPRVQEGDTSFQGVQNAASIGAIVNLCFEAAVEETLQDPTIVMDFPVEVSPLAKPHRSKPGLVERFELYIAGQVLPMHPFTHSSVRPDCIDFYYAAYLSLYFSYTTRYQGQKAFQEWSHVYLTFLHQRR